MAPRKSRNPTPTPTPTHRVAIVALRTITDAGHNIPRGGSEPVDPALAAEWVARGWAEKT